MWACLWPVASGVRQVQAHPPRGVQALKQTTSKRTCNIYSGSCIEGACSTCRHAAHMRCGRGGVLNSDMHLHPCRRGEHAAILYSGGKSPLPSTIWDMGTPVAGDDGLGFRV